VCRHALPGTHFSVARQARVVDQSAIATLPEPRAMTNPTRTFRERLHWVFVGSDGIRAVWSILIFLLLVAIPAGAINFVVRHVFHIAPNKAAVHELRPLLTLSGEALFCVLILAATAVMARIEHRRFGAYGLQAGRVGVKVVIGWLGGFGCLSLLVGLLASGHFLIFDGLALHGGAILGYGLIWLAGFAAVGLAEETTFRGYILSRLTRAIGFWPAALLTSLLFGASHIANHGETALGLTAVVAAGLVFCLLLRVTGSLWVGIGFHAAWDWAQSYLYGTPDSGLLARGHLLISHAAGDARFSGSDVGPEGSVLAAPVMIAGLLALVWVCRRPAMRLGSREAVAAE
jgi:membrane protease YdiL (CAAX protease family)